MTMEIKKVTDASFSAYGKVLDGYDLSGLLKAVKDAPLPEDVIYVPEDERLMAEPETDVLRDRKSVV